MARAAIIPMILAVFLLPTGVAAAEGRLIYRNPYTIQISETDETCSGDTVEIAGLLRHDIVIVEDARAGLHVSYTIRERLTGTSDTGSRYIGVGVFTGTEYFSADEVPANGTFIDTFRLISNDGSSNLLVHAFFHITVNGTGEITTFSDDLDIVCR